MQIKVTPTTISWDVVKEAGLKTAGLKMVNEPNSRYKRKIIASEHSPIRLYWFCIDIDNIKSYAISHLVRHKEDFESFVRTLRTDITKIKGFLITRETENSVQIHCNIQALINVSRKRLCRKSSEYTTEVWQNVVNEIAKIEPEVAEFCVPECIYRNGICPEGDKCCHFNKSNKFVIQLRRYLANF